MGTQRGVVTIPAIPSKAAPAIEIPVKTLSQFIPPFINSKSLFSIIILNFLSIYNININKYLKIFILLLSTLCAVYSIYKKK